MRTRTTQKTLPGHTVLRHVGEPVDLYVDTKPMATADGIGTVLLVRSTDTRDTNQYQFAFVYPLALAFGQANGVRFNER